MDEKLKELHGKLKGWQGGLSGHPIYPSYSVTPNPFPDLEHQFKRDIVDALLYLMEKSKDG